MPSYSTKQIHYEPFALCELFPPEDPHTFDEPVGMDEYEARRKRVMDPLDLQTGNGLHAQVFAFLHNVKVDPHEFTHILTFAEAAVSNGDTVETDRRFDDHVGHYRPDLIRATHATKPGCWLVFWSQAAYTPQLARLQRVNERRLYSNLAFYLRPLVPATWVRGAAQTLASLIDGFWLRASLSEGRIETEQAVFLCKSYIEQVVADGQRALANPDFAMLQATGSVPPSNSRKQAT